MLHRYHYPSPAPKWIRTMVLTTLVLPGTILTVSTVLNFIAIYYATINQIPVGK